MKRAPHSIVQRGGNVYSYIMIIERASRDIPQCEEMLFSYIGMLHEENNNEILVHWDAT